MPRKELFEAWETARRVRRLFRGGRVIDFAGGHGLLAHTMVILDASSPEALVVDRARPASSARLHDALVAAWPRASTRVRFVAADLESVAIGPDDVVVSSHACGALTDYVLDRAAAGRARVAVLPCCHHLEPGARGDLEGWLDGPLAMDAERAVRLRARGYRVWTQSIPSAITPQNRLLLGAPLGTAGG